MGDIQLIVLKALAELPIDGLQPPQVGLRAHGPGDAAGQRSVPDDGVQRLPPHAIIRPAVNSELVEQIPPKVTGRPNMIACRAVDAKLHQVVRLDDRGLIRVTDRVPQDRVQGVGAEFPLPPP